MEGLYKSKNWQRAIASPDGVFALALVGEQEFPLYRDSQGGLWVAGVPGVEFGIEMIVPTGRFAILVTVDGVNTQNGRPSSGDLSHEVCWVVTPPTYLGANVIPGWSRAGGEKAAAFTFARVAESYVAQIGLDVKNTGVVGAKFGHEAPRPRVTYRGGTSRGLGTGYGKEVDFHVEATEFNLDRSRPISTAILRYAEETQLVKAGFTKVQPTELPEATKADPFPGERLPGYGAPPPAGWGG